VVEAMKVEECLLSRLGSSLKTVTVVALKLLQATRGTVYTAVVVVVVASAAAAAHLHHHRHRHHHLRRKSEPHLRK
jgi:hypothetical protein